MGSSAQQLLFACVIFSLLSGCSLGEETLFQEYPSPDGLYNMRVTITESRMPQGPLYVSVYLFKNLQNEVAEKIFHSKLENDGVPFTATNIAVRWMSKKTALVCLRATDLPDHGVYIEINESFQLSLLEDC
jgi:hypothetical protein